MNVDRNETYMWLDKRVLKFFRATLPKKHYKNINAVYVALSEIGSDIITKKIKTQDLIETTSEYAGLRKEVVRHCLDALFYLELFNYELGEKLELELYVWQEPSTKQVRVVKQILEEQAIVVVEKVRPKKRKKKKEHKKKKENPIIPEKDYHLSLPKEKDKKKKIIKKEKKKKKVVTISNKTGVQTIQRVDYYKELLQYFPTEWQEDKTFKVAIKNFVTNRKEMRRPLTKLACKKIYNKLNIHPKQVVIEALERSVENGWTSVFPRASNTKSNPTLADVLSITTKRCNLSKQEARGFTRLIRDNKDKFINKAEFASALSNLLIWLTNMQMVPSQRKLIKALHSKNELTRKKAEVWMSKIPSPFMLVQEYLKWLDNQNWLKHWGKHTLNQDGNLFRSFLNTYQKRIGYNVFSGERITT